MSERAENIFAVHYSQVSRHYSLVVSFAKMMFLVKKFVIYYDIQMRKSGHADCPERKES